MQYTLQEIKEIERLAVDNYKKNTVLQYRRNGRLWASLSIHQLEICQSKRIGTAEENGVMLEIVN